MTVATFPDVESVFCDLLPTFADGLDTGLVTPASLPALFARVHRVSGADDLVTDTADLVIDVLAPTRAAAKAASEAIRAGLTAGPHVVGGVVIDTVRTLAAPTEVPWSPDVRRLTATYRATLRRSAS